MEVCGAFQRELKPTGEQEIRQALEAGNMRYDVDSSKAKTNNDILEVVS